MHLLLPAKTPDVETTLHRSRVARWAYLGLGWIFFGLGIIGAVLPVIPGTPFMLLALWAFTRGSTRLEHWLLQHRWFGSRLRAWRQAHVVSLPIKLTAWISMALSLTAMIVFQRVPWWLIVPTALLMAFGALYLARCPSRLPDVDSQRADAPAP